MSPEMLNGLAAAIRDTREDDTVKAIVFTGAGSGFCVGADLSAPRPDPAARPWRRPRGERYPHLAMRHCDKPVIGAINGHAVGGGFGLAPACFESFGVSRCFLTEDAQEGVRAFVEKPAPIFRGR